MERLFPRALVACIREARPPTSQELASMAEKIWRETYPKRPFRRERAMTIAAVALTGECPTRKGPPESCPAEPFSTRMRSATVSRWSSGLSRGCAV